MKVPPQPRILVIDDDETILDLLRDTLSPYYQISTAHDSLEGVELMMSERFDLLIIDLGMPVLDGVELIQKIRANSPFNKIPILVLSAYPELRARLRGADVEAVMAKPFSIDMLQKTVARIVGAEAGRPPAANPNPDNTSTASAEL